MANVKDVKGGTKAELPAGFEDAAPKDTWVKIEAGTVIQGILLEVTARRSDPEKQVMRIKLTKANGLKGIKGSEVTEDKETFDLQEGDEVCMDVRARLSSIAELADDPTAEYEVFIRARAKVGIEGGHTMWLFDTGKKVHAKRNPGNSKRQGPPSDDPRFR
jgi:hypothetical protein